MTCQFSTPEDYQKLIATLPGPEKHATDAASVRQNNLTKPQGSLGRLEEIAIWLAGWQGVEKPLIKHPLCLIFAGNHGVVANGVSAFPPEVTAQMVANFSAGGAAINQLTKAGGIELRVHPLDLDRPTADFTKGAAMSIDETLAAMQTGADAVSDDADILLVGEMGIGNTTAASAIALGVLGGEASIWTGRGTGLNDESLKRKESVVASACAVNRDAIRDGGGLGILAALGGREMAAIAGATLEARHRRLPVLVDGFITTASLLPLFHDNISVLEHCLISHCSVEPGHTLMLEKTGQRALFDLGMRLGEGSGAALALPVIRAAAATHSGMATFSEAGVATDETN